LQNLRWDCTNRYPQETFEFDSLGEVFRTGGWLAYLAPMQLFPYNLWVCPKSGIKAGKYWWIKADLLHHSCLQEKKVYCPQRI
jgi:hypothetical protein